MTTLETLLAGLEELAPLGLAADWDNVGLLLQPRSGDPPVRRVMLTIDLTEPVFNEATAASADLIVAYHPPIFAGLKRLVRREPLHRVLLGAARQGIAIYSPHTALDAVNGGVNDWLLAGLGPVAGITAIEPAVLPGMDTPSGMGRRGVITEPATLNSLVGRLKSHLDLSHLRLAAAPAHAAGVPISRVAVCPGAGGGLFAGVNDVDLLVTGEMRHHDVLARVAAGTSVVLTEHTNCERGYLPIYQRRLQAQFGKGIDFLLARNDADPLRFA